MHTRTGLDVERRDVDDVVIKRKLTMQQLDESEKVAKEYRFD